MELNDPWSRYERATARQLCGVRSHVPLELVDGAIYAKAYETERHDAIADRLSRSLAGRLAALGLYDVRREPVVETRAHFARRPDVCVSTIAGQPLVVIEFLSDKTRSNDQVTKLAEYQELPTVELVAFIDLDRSLVRVVQRGEAESWSDRWLPAGSSVELATLGVTLSPAEIFAFD